MSLGTRIARMSLLIAAMALATVALGWWGVVFAAAAFGLIDRRDGSALDAGIAAGLAWALLLGVAAGRGEVFEVARAVGGAVGIPASALLITAVAFPAALAWSCAAVCRLLRPPAASRPVRSADPTTT
jgi:hypothetical protein